MICLTMIIFNIKFNRNKIRIIFINYELFLNINSRTLYKFMLVDKFIFIFTQKLLWTNYRKNESIFIVSAIVFAYEFWIDHFYFPVSRMALKYFDEATNKCFIRLHNSKNIRFKKKLFKFDYLKLLQNIYLIFNWFKIDID